MKGFEQLGTIRTACKPATLLKVTLLHGCFSRFLNCTNGTKSRNASHVFKYKYCQPNEKVLLIGHNSKCGF